MREVRYVESEFELRGQPGGGGVLEGYAAVYNAPTIIAGMFREQVAPGAFTKTMKESDVRALFNHDSNVVLGRNRAGTLQLKSDVRGLAYSINLPDTQQARDLWTLIDRGDVSQSSFSFEMRKQQFEEPADAGGLPLRTLREVRLYDVSPVTFPAYETTEVQARSIMGDFVLCATTQEPETEPGEPLVTDEPGDTTRDTTREPERREWARRDLDLTLFRWTLRERNHCG